MTSTLSRDVEQLSSRLDAASRGLGLSLQQHQLDQLLAYLSLLQRWNAVHNLSAAQDIDQLLSHHLLDSLAVVRPLMRHANGRALLRVLDVGTGAGLPAVVLAITQPTWAVTAVDAVAKKIAFVRQAGGEMVIPNLIPVHARVEKLRPAMLFDVVVSRAFSSLDKFVSCSRRVLAADGVWVAMKGKHPEAEFSALGDYLQVFHVEPLQVPGLTAERCLVWIRNAAAAA